MVTWVHELIRSRHQRLLHRSSTNENTISRLNQEKKVYIITLQGRTYEWVLKMAMEHSNGSIHKAMRDLLNWAIEGSSEDHQWLFTHPFVELPTHCNNPNIHQVRARIDINTAYWIENCVKLYQLDGPAHLLDAICRATVALDATHDVFASVEAGYALPTRSADLYYDLGIFSKPIPITTDVS